VLLVAVLVAGCASGGDIAGDSDSSIAASVATEPTAEATVVPTPTLGPTPRPTPQPEAEVEFSREFVTAWGDGDPYVNYQVIIEVTNNGGGWAQLDAFNSDFQVLDASGGLVTTGGFLYHSPEFLGPGETGYLVEPGGVADGVTADQFVDVEVSGNYDDVAGPEVTFAFEDLQTRPPTYADFEGFTVTGFVTSDTDLESMAIIVVCVGADGQPLGATYTNLVENVTGGQRKGFETVGSMPLGLDPASCAELRAFGDGTGF